MVPLKSTSIGVLLFVILTDVPEVKKIVFLKENNTLFFIRRTPNTVFMLQVPLKGKKWYVKDNIQRQ